MLALPPPHPAQAQIAMDQHRFRLVIAGRRFGKTVLGVVEAVRCAARGGQAMWAAPTYGLARHGWDPLRRIFSQVPGAQIRLTDREVSLPSGGRILVRSADHPESMRGYGLDLVVLDEAAFIKPEVWPEVVRPTLSDRAGRALLICTPAGFGWLCDLWEQTADDPDWGRWQCPTSANPHISPAELDAARRSVGTRVFAQEYEAQFLAGAGALVRSEWLRYWTRSGDSYRLGDELVPVAACRRVMTVDPAASMRQTADYTAVAVAAVTPHPVAQLIVLEVWRARIEGPDQVRVIHSLADKWRPDWVGIEAVAYQATLAQYLAREAGLTVRMLTVAGDKVDRALPLCARLEAGDVWLPEGAAFLGDLERELLTFPHGTHDDQVDALAYLAREAFVRGPRYLEGPLGV